MNLGALKKISYVKRFAERLNNLYARRDFVQAQLSKIRPGSLLLDAGCGSQQFREFCDHVSYKSQDFGQYYADEKKMLGSEGSEAVVTGVSQPGEIDYVGDIWKINADDASFDVILCTEVFEHIPYPVATLREFARLLKRGGVLILTAPSNCLRHMDPYFFYSGFSDRWFEKFLPETGFTIDSIEPVGDYYSWISVEIWRTARSHSLFAKLILLPSFFYYFFKRKTRISTDTLCMGYHIVATKA